MSFDIEIINKILFVHININYNEVGGWRSSTVEKVLSLHMADQNLIPRIPDGLPSIIRSKV